MWPILFDVLVIGLLIADVAFFVVDNYAGSYIVLALALAAVYFSVDSSMFHAGDFWHSLLYYGKWYIAIGAGVALIKWILFNLNVVAHIRSKRQLFEEQHTRDQLTDAFSRTTHNDRCGAVKSFDGYRRFRFMQFWDESVKYKHFPRAQLGLYAHAEHPDAIARHLTPKAINYIGSITFWVLQWPVVLVGTFISDVLLRIGRHLATLFDVLFVGPIRQMIRAAVKGL